MPKKGYKQTEEHKRKNSELKMGEKRKPFTEEARKNMSKAGKIKIFTGEHRKNISIANTGKYHTEETKRRMSEAASGEKNHNFGKHLSKETKKKLSVANSGENHPRFGKYHTEETKKQMSKSHKNPSKKTRELMSKTRAERIASGKIKYGKGGHFYSEKNKKKLWYRSSYEFQAYKILEKVAKVVKYEAEPIYIPYRFQGLVKNYVPDILVTYDDNTRELIEIMSEWQTGDSIRLVKFQSAKKYCKNNNIIFSVWTEKEIFRA